MIKIVSWAAEENGADFFDIFKKVQADIFCVQDMQLSEAQFMGFNPAGYISYWNWKDKNKKLGTAVFTRLDPLRIEWGIGVREDKGGRTLTLEYEEFYLVNVLTPLSKQKYDPDRLEWDLILANYVQKLLAKKPVVICGSMKLLYRGYREMERIDPQNEMSSLEKLGMTGTYRYNRPAPGNPLMRMDYCLVSNNLQSKLLSCTIHNAGPEIVHTPLEMTFSIEAATVPVTHVDLFRMLYWANAMPKPLDFIKEAEADDEQNCCLYEKKH